MANKIDIIFKFGINTNMVIIQSEISSTFICHTFLISNCSLGDIGLITCKKKF